MKQVEIADVDRTWQGYAEKWIALGILSLWTDKKIHPKDILTRGEFAKMLSTMIDYNSCTFSDATIDTDGDGITDIHDTCPSVRGVAEKDGCPNIAVFNYGLTMEHILTGENKWSSDPTDRDGDGIRDSEDLCPTLVGTSANAWCPGISIMSGIPENKCLAEVFQNRGIMFASPVCATCPCENSINMQSLVRTCDVIFPAVLSKDEKTVYSRGDLFLIH